MKSNTIRIIVLGTVVICGVIAWSPPASEDLVVGTGNSGLTSPSGQLGVIGDDNNGTARRTLVVGKSHQLINDRSGSVVSGSSNIVDAVSSLVVGFNNNASGPDGMGYSGIIGGNNTVNAAHGYAIGYYNTVYGDYSATLGHDLEIGAAAAKAVALGRYNSPMDANDVLSVGTGTGDSVTERNTSLRATSDGSLILGSATSGTVVLAKSQGDISMGDYAN